MRLPHRRQFLHLAAGAAALPSVSGITRAQDRPSRPVRIIVGFTAGSATDITARLFAQKLNEAWKTPVMVENIPGAGGSMGAERVAKSAPDGSTLYWGANGARTINPSLQPSPAFDPALADHFRTANARGVRLSGLRGHLLVRAVSASRHAGRRRQQGACGHRADRRASRLARADRAARP